MLNVQFVIRHLLTAIFSWKIILRPTLPHSHAFQHHRIRHNNDCMFLASSICFLSSEKVHASVSNAPNCNMGPYGCCEDKTTFAKGPNMEGCPPQTNQNPLQTAVLESPAYAQSKCQQEQQKLKAMGAMDMFVPECEPSGLFKALQCYTYPSSGKEDCWCVDQNTGQEIPGTRITGSRPNCGGIYLIIIYV